jgi:hypothetical protein
VRPADGSGLQKVVPGCTRLALQNIKLLSKEINLPVENFSWVIPKKLAGSAMPGGTAEFMANRVLADLSWLHREGIRCLISLNEMPPVMGELCGEIGLEWLDFPVEDFDIPGDRDAFAGLVYAAIDMMKKSRPVCVHCRAGVGRTGMLLSCIAGIYFSLDGEKAIALVKKGREAIDTGIQGEFVRLFLLEEAASGRNKA